MYVTHLAIVPVFQKVDNTILIHCINHYPLFIIILFFAQ